MFINIKADSRKNVFRMPDSLEFRKIKMSEKQHFCLHFDFPAISEESVESGFLRASGFFLF
ncbi:MAG: hypothetical protein ACI350_00360 [Prevotella sp.]